VALFEDNKGAFQFNDALIIRDRIIHAYDYDHSGPFITSTDRTLHQLLPFNCCPKLLSSSKPESTIHKAFVDAFADIIISTQSNPFECSWDNSLTNQETHCVHPAAQITYSGSDHLLRRPNPPTPA
jgi:methionine synthase I (cobalamin-dependent)